MNRRKLFFLIPLIATITVVILGATKGHAAEEQFDVKITSPKDSSNAGREVVVRGTASIPSGHHLWVLARRKDFKPLWWPQREAEIDPKTHEWEATAGLGGEQDIGWYFDIGVITVNANEHQKLMAYWEKAMETGDWKPKKIPPTTSPPRTVKVKKVSHQASQ